MVDVSFEDGGGKTAEDIKDEQDGKAGVRKVESQGDISADYKNEDQDSHLTRTEVVVHPVGPESGEADCQIQYTVQITPYQETGVFRYIKTGCTNQAIVRVAAPIIPEYMIL